MNEYERAKRVILASMQAFAKGAGDNQSVIFAWSSSSGQSLAEPMRRL
jgi:hypothetical protein